MCVLTSVLVYLCEHVCVCEQNCALCYHVWSAGSPPGDEDIGQVLNWPPCESYILCTLSLFHLFAVTNLILHVCNTGSPRGDEDVGEVTLHADPLFVRFDVTAFPTPTEVTFAFLGSSANGTGSSQTEPDGIRLEGVCGPHKAVVFRSTCFVLVSNVTTQRAAGFYRVTVTNTQGSAHFRLQIKYQGRSELAGQK